MQKNDTSLVVRKKLSDELKLELSAEVNSRIVETEALIRSELRKFNGLSRYERDETK